MSKWLSVCIFLLLAIACIVDLEPTEIATPVAPIVPDEIVTPVMPVTPAEIVTPAALGGEELTNASASLAANGAMPRILATRGWKHASPR